MFLERFKKNREYVMILKNIGLLQNHLMEACLWEARLFETKRNRNYDPGHRGQTDGIHWGWESPTCQLRGHFLGHWLSAAAFIYEASGDKEAKAKADAVIDELERCQIANGGEWVGSIPSSYLDRIAGGQDIWAPHYTMHKTLMGLWDMYEHAASSKALDILAKQAHWFHRWSGAFTHDQMDEILDVETGGMLEIWANLYGATGEKQYRELMERYSRERLFKPLLEGKDVLTNRHANTTVPEILGAARAYEVTGESRWRDIVQAYWKCAVTDRGFFCTGSQTSGEGWTPPFQFSSRMNDTNQEHCFVYNMMRLAEYLFRWTGDTTYADYIERNLYNGILAQQNPRTGMVSYFLPIEAGSHKIWGSPTNDFWCCHGTLVQANALHGSYVYYEDGEGLTIAQYVPSEISWKRGSANVLVDQTIVSNGDKDDNRRTYTAGKAMWHRPENWEIAVRVKCDVPCSFKLSLRLPWWVDGLSELTVDGRKEKASLSRPGFLVIDRTWNDDEVRLVLPKKLVSCPMPDRPDMIAVMDGPVVLAGLCSEERKIIGDPEDPSSFLTPDNEREWWKLLGGYRTYGQDPGIRFIPLYDVIDESYTLYFPVEKRV
jgi:hypothetical protein